MGESPGIVLNHEQSATGLLSGGDYRSRDPKLGSRHAHGQRLCVWTVTTEPVQAPYTTCREEALDIPPVDVR